MTKRGQLTRIEDWKLGAVYVQVTMTKGVIRHNDEWTCTQIHPGSKEVTLRCEQELFRAVGRGDFRYYEASGHFKTFCQWEWYRRFRLYSVNPLWPGQ